MDFNNTTKANKTLTGNRCPLRRLEAEPAAAVLPEFISRSEEMPPDHHILMKRFQENPDLRNLLDQKFGNNKEKLLEQLWLTHKQYYRPLDTQLKKDCAIVKWLDNIEPTNENTQEEQVDEPCPKELPIKRLIKQATTA